MKNTTNLQSIIYIWDHIVFIIICFFFSLFYKCISEEDSTERSGSYWCKCREGYFYPGANLSWKGFSGEDIESGSIDSPRLVI